MKMKLDYSTLQEKVTSNLREAILTQKFMPGDRLVQEELAETLGVSRMPIREALRRLEIEGLIEMVPHKGAVVKKISKQDIEEIYFLRSLLEGLAVEKSMNHLSAEDIKELEKLVEEMDRDVEQQNIEQFMQHNTRFHQMLRNGNDWKRIDTFIQYLWNGYPPYVPSLLPETISKSNQEHKAILQAVKEKDPVKVRKLIENHIGRTGEALLSFLK